MSEERCKVETSLTSAQLAAYLAALPATNGWTPVLGVAADGARRVFSVTWTGGTGTAPANGYVGAAGIVSDIADALDVRGAAGSSVLLPLEAYTETGTTLAFGASVAIPLDGKSYALTITGDTTLSVIPPTAPECGSAILYGLISTATPPVIATGAGWNWPDKLAGGIPTTNGARFEMVLNSTPQGWIIARVMSIGVPA